MSDETRESDKIATVILARGGSKGIRGKNTRPLNGKPLIAWTIESALEAGLTPIVNTDSEEIADVARTHGAQVPFMRPAELAQDKTDTMEVLSWLLTEQLQDAPPEWMMLLQPTSPLRIAKDVQGALSLWRDKQSNVLSVVRVRKPPHWLVELDAHERLVPFLERPVLNRRQHMPELFMPNGAIYIMRATDILARTPIMKTHPVPFEMPEERSIDIDTILDWQIAEMLLKRRAG